ncbi:hypothetical protein DEU56DRAFT_755687 [Suillus clintonianus]|uniref:uncharacterized protein n=1 Tax=Suillus clintonianus TaxID=1904413 RepID=UPI001B8826AF|nr:uncharacterized protein DEU56DRAFT_755687 [Suillus clintonianus]KAG2138969.1 hypothetical protein DEU56DRAFT_755687 [Suillus clintonianus]
MSLKVSDPRVLKASIVVDLLVCCNIKHDLQVAGKDGNGRNHFIVCADDEVNDGDRSRGLYTVKRNKKRQILTKLLGSRVSAGTLRMTGQADKNNVDVSYSIQMAGRDIDTVAAHDVWATIALPDETDTMEGGLRGPLNRSAVPPAAHFLGREKTPDKVRDEAEHMMWKHKTVTEHSACIKVIFPQSLSIHLHWRCKVLLIQMHVDEMTQREREDKETAFKVTLGDSKDKTNMVNLLVTSTLTMSLKHTLLQQ